MYQRCDEVHVGDMIWHLNWLILCYQHTVIQSYSWWGRTYRNSNKRINNFRIMWFVLVFTTLITRWSTYYVVTVSSITMILPIFKWIPMGNATNAIVLCHWLCSPYCCVVFVGAIVQPIGTIVHQPTTRSGMMIVLRANLFFPSCPYTNGEETTIRLWLLRQREDTFTNFEIETWLPDFIRWIDPYRIFLLPDEVGLKWPSILVITSLFDKGMIPRPKLEMHAKKPPPRKQGSLG